MNVYTKEQLKELKELDVIKHFDTVLNSDYKRGTIRTVDEKVADIYENATNTKVLRNFTCKSCVFNLYKLAGLLYRTSVKYYQDENLKKARETKQIKKNNNKVKEDK